MIFFAAVVLGGLFVFQRINQKVPEDPALLALRQGITQGAAGSSMDLSEEAQGLQFLSQLQAAQEQAVKSNFDSVAAINEVARLKLLLGDEDGARQAWEYLTLIRPKNALAFASLGRLYHHNLGLYQKAEDYYLRALVNDPHELATIRNFFELYHNALRDDAKAEALLQEALKTNPQAAELYALAGKFYQDLGQISQAVENYQEHLKLNPANDAVRKELLKLKAKLGP